MTRLTQWILCFAILVIIVPSASALMSFSGSMSSGDGTVGSDGLWESRGFLISWQINELEDGWWRYEYYVPALRPNAHPSLGSTLPGQFALEMEAPTYSSLFRSMTGSTMSTGSFDPGMSGAAMSNALLFDVTSTWVTFETKYVPSWGDFFARHDGGYVNPETGLEEENRAWNSGYSLGSTGDTPPGDGVYMNKILLPDAHSAIPEPGTMLLFGLGLAGAGIYRRVRSNEK